MVDNARELVVVNVVTAYLYALRAKATRDTLVAQTALAKDLYQLTRSRADQGVAAELDANRAKQQENSLEQQRQEGEQDYIDAKLSLADILHARPTSNYEVSDQAAYGSGDPPQREIAMRKALAARADHRSLEAKVRGAELHVSSVKAFRIPTLRMAFSDGQSGDSPEHNNNVYRLAGVIDVPIFTGGNIRGQIEEAEGALREARALLDQNESKIETDVLAAISAIEWARRELETSMGNVVLSRQELEWTRSRFAQGIADNTEVVNAQDRLTKADDARIRAEYALGLARANLARAIGNAEVTYRR
jgi:outer membrane protein TolC